MYVVDGVAYAGEPVEGIEVASARYVGNSILLVTFSTGEVRLFEVTCLLHIDVYKRQLLRRATEAFCLACLGFG